MKKLFQSEPMIEMMNTSQIRIIGNYKFIEASEAHCKFYYEDFLVKIEASSVHINVLREEEIIVHVDELKYFEMKRQVKEL